jgi:hypothetical protein
MVETSFLPKCHAVTTPGKFIHWQREEFNSFLKLKTPWPESASELYRPSDRRFSVK